MTIDDFFARLESFRGRFTVDASCLIRLKSNYSNPACPLAAVFASNISNAINRAVDCGMQRKDAVAIANSADYNDLADQQLRKRLLEYCD